MWDLDLAAPRPRDNSDGLDVVQEEESTDHARLQLFSVHQLAYTKVMTRIAVEDNNDPRQRNGVNNAFMSDQGGQCARMRLDDSNTLAHVVGRRHVPVHVSTQVAAAEG